MQSLQPHILVTGHSGAGKSTTASQLSQRLGMPVYSIDSRSEWGDLFRGDPDDEHLIPGTDKRREFIQLRRRLALESLTGLTQPTIVEGTQLAGLTNRELASYPNRVMVTTPLKELLRQRLERVRDKAIAKGKPWDAQIAAKRQAAGRRIYDDNAKVFRRVSKVPGTVLHNSRSDVQELIAKLQLPKLAAVVSIIKGNPDADPDNAAKYEDFYSTVADIVRQQGATVKFDEGLSGTVPDGDIWLGHSRGADRLRFAPAGVNTLRLDDFEPAVTKTSQREAYNQLFKQHGYKSIAEVPIEMRPKPGPEHYTLSPEARSAIVNLLQQASAKQAASPLVAAGLCVLAADTGRVLMLQRAFDDTDPASGKWEFPGGHIERGETPLEAAKREWEEEVGCRLPAHLQIHVDWRSGVYVGYVGSIPSEKDLKINNKGRRVLNPDDPDRDNIEIVAWWKPKDIKGNPVIRRELARVYKDKVHWAIKLSQLQLRRLDTMQKTAAVSDLIKNLASTSAGSAVLGAGVGAGAGMLRQVLKPKEERDYAGGALLGAGIGAGAGYGIKQLANSDPVIENGIAEKYEATRRLLKLMYQPASEQKLGGGGTITVKDALQQALQQQSSKRAAGTGKFMKNLGHYLSRGVTDVAIPGAVGGYTAHQMHENGAGWGEAGLMGAAAAAMSSPRDYYNAMRAMKSGPGSKAMASQFVQNLMPQVKNKALFAGLAMVPAGYNVVSDARRSTGAYADATESVTKDIANTTKNVTKGIDSFYGPGGPMSALKDRATELTGEGGALDSLNKMMANVNSLSEQAVERSPLDRLADAAEKSVKYAPHALAGAGVAGTGYLLYNYLQNRTRRKIEQQQLRNLESQNELIREKTDTERVRKPRVRKAASLDNVVNHICQLTPKQASQLSTKLAVRALLQKAGADAIEIVMNQRAVQAAGILDNIKATLADPSTRPYATALIGSGLGAVGGAAKSLLMDDPENRSVLRSAILGAGIGGLGGGIYGKFTKDGPAVVDPNVAIEGRPHVAERILRHPTTAMGAAGLAGTIGAGLGHEHLGHGVGHVGDFIGNMHSRVAPIGKAITGVGRRLNGTVGRGASGAIAGLGTAAGTYLLGRYLQGDKQSGFASLSGPLGKGYTERVAKLVPPPKEPKESKAPAPSMPGPMILNPNGTPVVTQTPAAPTGIGGMPAPPTMPKIADGGMLKWISDKWADPTNRAMMGAAGGAAAGSLGMLGAEALSPDKKRRRYLNAALTGALGGAAVGGGLGQLSNLSSGGVPDRDLSEVEANILKTPGGVKQLDKAVQSQTPGPVQNAGKLVGELYDESPALASTGVGAAVHYGTRNNPLLQNFVNKTELAHDPQMAELQKLFAAAQRGGGTASVGGQTKTLSEIGDLITKRTKDIHAGTGARRFAAGRGFRRSLPGLAAAGLTWGGPALVNWMRGE